MTMSPRYWRLYNLCNASEIEFQQALKSQYGKRAVEFRYRYNAPDNAKTKKARARFARVCEARFNETLKNWTPTC